MKRIYTILTAILIATSAFAQSPDKMSYQAVIRDAKGTLVTARVGMKLSIQKGENVNSASEMYSETLTPTPNANGLISVEFGGQTGWNAIDWATGKFFIKTETDIDNDGTYDIEGISQLLSVPYALHAKIADSITGAVKETDPIFDASVASAITKTDTINWNNKLDTEIDGSVTNELQTLSISNDTLYLTNGGFVKLPEQQTKTYAVGDYALGGMVIKINADGTHGLVIALTDQAYDGVSDASLVDFNEAPCRCSDTSRFDEAGKQYLDWRLPYVDEVNHLPRLISYDPPGIGSGALLENNILKDIHMNLSGDARYYWFADVKYCTESEVSDFDDKSLYRRLNGQIYSSYNFNSGNSDISDKEDLIKYLEYPANVRCIRSF